MKIINNVHVNVDEKINLHNAQINPEVFDNTTSMDAHETLIIEIINAIQGFECLCALNLKVIILLHL